MKSRFGFVCQIFGAGALFFSLPAWAIDVTELVANAGIKATQQFGAPYVGFRCESLLRACRNNPMLTYNSCTQSLSQYIAAAQLGRGDGFNGKMESTYKTTSYFSSEVAEMRNDPDVGRYLNLIETRLANSKPFNLWTFTMNTSVVRRAQEPKAFAIKLLAALFQRQQLTINKWSGTRFVQLTKVNDALLRRIKDGSLEAYPPPMKMPNTGIYHFYANAYLAKKLHGDGVPLAYAAAAPWALNEKYEESKGNPKKEQTQRDIYNGYAGANFALSKDSMNYSGPSFAKYSDDVKSGSHPKAFIEHLPGFCRNGAIAHSPAGHFAIDRRMVLEPVTAGVD